MSKGQHLTTEKIIAGVTLALAAAASIASFVVSVLIYLG